MVFGEAREKARDQAGIARKAWKDRVLRFPEDRAGGVLTNAKGDQEFDWIEGLVTDMAAEDWDVVKA
ncbi:MAG TPA: hypothetical protein VN838_28655 [Bradyrhizobium sp.]|nr:hypothetical protein [Bradyrhizobium sp.]